VVGVVNPGDQTSTEGDAVSLSVTAVAASGTLSYSAGGLPDGLSIDPSTGVISGTVAAWDAAEGPYTVTVAAGNGTAADSTTFNWTINPLASMTAVADQSNAEGDAVSLGVTASEAGATLTYSADGLPDGLSINSSTGLISGTVATGDAIDGPYVVVVTASDGTYGTFETFNWTVTGADETTPTLTNPGTQANVAGDVVSLALTAADADGALLTYSETGLPDGLSLDPDLGVISGVIADDAVQPAPYVVTVTAADGNGIAASQTFDWVVNDAAPAVTGDAISQTQGAGDDTFTVASFTDPDLNAQASDFTATINWGDGQSSQGEVDGSGNAFTVSGDHVYLEPGTFTVGVTVTDAAGGTGTASATATVADASLAASGGFEDGALAGTSATVTVATFTDANNYGPASGYAATIDWGDGTTATAGVIGGAYGEFAVSGAHTYAADGSYTITATIDDGNGETATATSTAVVADVYAEVDSQLTVASFHTADASATTSSFTATITWGDGTQSAGQVVAGSGSGNFQVVGTHAYAAAGAYTVQAAVTDAAGHTINASAAVKAVAAPIQAFGDNVEEDAEGAVNDVLLATFTIPDANGNAGSYTAATAWGDGSTSAVGLVNEGGGVWEALGSHDYATVGVYEFQTLLYNAAGQLVAVSDPKANYVPPKDLILWSGPKVVPGNSAYQFEITFPATPEGDINPEDAWTFTADGATGSAHHTVTSGSTDWTGFYIDLTFPNKPEVVQVRISNLFRGDPGFYFGFDVVVVAVKVADEPISATVPTSFQAVNDLVDNGAQQFDLQDAKVVMVVGPPISGPVPNQDVKEVGIDSQTMPLGIRYQAKVTLIGPDGNKYLDSIQVGFHQTVSFISDRALNATNIVESSDVGDTYLDTVFGKPPPWYDRDTGLVTGDEYIRKGSVPFVISDSDSPTLAAVVQYFGLRATEIQESKRFTLGVAAATVGEGAADSHLFQEASASWWYSASGTITIFTSTGRATWTPGANAGVKPPAGGDWTLNVPPPSGTTGLLTTGTLANDRDRTFTYLAR